MASIQRTKSGTWKARYRDAANKEHAKHFGRKGDAQDWLDSVTTAMRTHTYADPRAGRVTFRAYFDDWAANQVWVDTTARAMSLAVRSTPFADVELRRIRTTDVEAWVKSMSVASPKRKRPLAPGTVKTRFNNVRSVFRAAVRDKVIGIDPTVGVRLPRQRKREASMAIPTPGQVRLLLDAAGEQSGAFVALAAFAGLRLGEVAALQVGDIDFLRRQVHVRRQVQRAGGQQVEIRLPKYNSERTVPVPQELLDIVAEHIRLTGRTGWLFADEDADPPHQNTVGYWWRKTAAAAGVTDFTLHDLRHFFASGLIAAGCDVVTVQRALGHAKPTTTLSTYSHLWPTAEDRTRRAVASLAGQVFADAGADSCGLPAVSGAENSV